MLFYSTHVTRHKTGISWPRPENAGVRDSACPERVKQINNAIEERYPLDATIYLLL